MNDNIYDGKNDEVSDVILQKVKLSPEQKIKLAIKIVLSSGEKVFVNYNGSIEFHYLF